MCIGLHPAGFPLVHLLGYALLAREYFFAADLISPENRLALHR
jgi:hypothetical protein